MNTKLISNLIRLFLVAFSVMACGVFSIRPESVQPTNNTQPTESPVSIDSGMTTTPSYSEGIPLPWKVDIVSVQPNHVDYIIYNISDIYISAPWVTSAILDGEVNGQMFTYSDVQITPVQIEYPVNPTYPGYQRWTIPQITDIPPGFSAGKFRVTWSIPQTVQPRFLNLTFGDDNALSERIDLSIITGSDNQVPTLPENPKFLTFGTTWSVGQKWDITPLGVKRINIIGPASGIEITIKNIGGYTASFRNDLSVLLFTKNGEIINIEWDWWAMFLNVSQIPNEIKWGGEYCGAPPDWGNYCGQMDPAVECQGIIIFDSADACLNPLTGEYSYMRDEVDPNAPLIDYSGSLMVIRYRPTGEFVIFRVSD